MQQASASVGAGLHWCTVGVHQTPSASSKMKLLLTVVRQPRLKFDLIPPQHSSSARRRRQWLRPSNGTVRRGATLEKHGAATLPRTRRHHTGAYKGSCRHHHSARGSGDIARVTPQVGDATATRSRGRVHQASAQGIAWAGVHQVEKDVGKSEAMKGRLRPQ